MLVTTNAVKDVLAAVEQLSPTAQDTLLFLIAEDQPPDISRLIRQLNRRKLSFMGGIFPGIIYNHRHYKSGTLITKFPTSTPPIQLPLNFSPHQSPEWQQVLKQLTESSHSCIMLVDGLSAHIRHFLKTIYQELGGYALNYFGGGAGSISLEQRPCVFSAAGLAKDAAVVAFSPWQSTIGVSHGWERFYGPIVATKTDGNIIKELNWQNAFELYREIVETDCQTPLTPENFFHIAKQYPFGIYKEGEEDVVRDPIAVTADGGLICVGDVPENTALHILRGNREKLIAAARQAANHNPAPNPLKLTEVLVADCISRTLFLESAFETELTTVASEIQRVQDVPVKGMLTLGEIATSGSLYLEFFNKTIVIGKFYETDRSGAVY
ncbi:MAG: histidine kinase [Calditrichaeota bacterium]|nr:histidine kinase [Calditrichota bacterium]